MGMFSKGKHRCRCNIKGLGGGRGWYSKHNIGGLTLVFNSSTDLGYI